MAPTLSVVVPVYNEAAFIPKAMPRLIEELEALGCTYRLHIVENGSTDDSAQVATVSAGDHPVTITSLLVADYGGAMRHGFLESDGEWVVNCDIDYFSGDFFRKVLEATDADLVIGSKRDPGSEDRRPLIRRAATLVFNLLLRVILRSHVSDTHGMKAFRRELVDELAGVVVSRQDLYDTELVIRAERRGYRIVEVPVVVEEMRAARSSLVKRVPRTIAGLLRIRRVLAADRISSSSAA